MSLLDTSGRLQSKQLALWGEAPWDGRADLANQNVGFCPQTTPCTSCDCPFTPVQAPPVQKVREILCFPSDAFCSSTRGVNKAEDSHGNATMSPQHSSCTGHVPLQEMQVTFNAIAATEKQSEHVAISPQHCLSPYAQILPPLQEPPVLPASSSVAPWNPQMPGTSLFLATWQISCSYWQESRDESRVSLWRGSKLLQKRTTAVRDIQANPLVSPCNRLRSARWRQMLQQMEASDRILGTRAWNREEPGAPSR